MGVFDSSYERGEPAEFPANRVIKGWVEALQEMKPCEARVLYIPADLAYGEKGRAGIPGGAALLFSSSSWALTNRGLLGAWAL